MSQYPTIPARHLLLSGMAQRAINDAARLSETWAAIWAELRRTLDLWRQRARTRAELRMIPDHRLNDLPIDTSILLSDRGKPFWRA